MTSEARLVTFEDTSPVITYRPSVDGATNSPTWHTIYPSGVFFPSIGPKDSKEGSGNSLRVTSTAMASFEFTFSGTSLVLSGTGNSSTYTVSIDENESELLTERDGVLASFSGLVDGQHRCVLTLRNPNPELSFDRAIFDSGGAGASSSQDINNMSGRWTEATGWYHQLNKHPSGDKQEVTVSNTALATAWLTFSGTSVTLVGNILEDHGNYRVWLQPGFDPEIFNGTSHYLVQRVTLFYKGGLDPNVVYNLTIQNLDQGRFLDYEYATVVGPETSAIPSSQETDTSGPHNPAESASPARSSSSSSPINTGAVIGAILGSIALILAITAFVFVLCRRRSRGRRSTTGRPTTSTSSSPVGLISGVEFPQPGLPLPDSQVRPYYDVSLPRATTRGRSGSQLHEAKNGYFGDSKIQHTVRSPLRPSVPPIAVDRSLISHGTPLLAYSH